MKGNSKNNNGGITLVALIITIVVLLILAGITLTYIVGDNSVFNQASKAKIQTELGKIEERAQFIYSDKLMKNISNNLEEKPSMQEIVAQLREEGKRIKQIAVSQNEIVGIHLDKENMLVGKRKTNIIKVTIEGPEELYRYYAVVDGKYYQMHFNKGNIEIDRTTSNISDIEEVETTLGVNSSDETIVTAEVDNNTNITTVTATNKEGIAIITVTYGKYSKTCEVTVKDISLTLNESFYIVTGGESWTHEVQLSATLTNSPDPVEKLAWSSSNTDIATVNNKGVVKAGKRGGDAIITATLTDGSNLSAECKIRTELFGKIKSEKEEFVDKNGNIVAIPENFAVGTSDNVNEVTKGLVIQDEHGNQFVWIPIGDVKKSDGTITNIELGRYEFNKTTGVPTIKQGIGSINSRVKIESYFETIKDPEEHGWTLPKDLVGFSSSANSNHGFFIARYMSSQSSISTAMAKYDEPYWCEMYNNKASSYARTMYDMQGIESDLINSYAYDTVLVFIQKFSGYDTFSIGTPYSPSGNPIKTGKAGDVACNIFDMGRSRYCYTTEILDTTYNMKPARGGSEGPYKRIGLSVSGGISNWAKSVGFRAIFYLK